MSRRAKGVNYQRWLCRWLEERGYACHNETMKPKRIMNQRTGKVMWVSVSNDIFNCIDIIAKRSDTPTLWIQASHLGSHRRRLESFAAVPFNEHDIVLLFEKRADGRHRIYQYFPPFSSSFDVSLSRPAIGSLSLIGVIERRQFIGNSKLFEKISDE